MVNSESVFRLNAHIKLFFLIFRFIFESGSLVSRSLIVQEDTQKYFATHDELQTLYRSSGRYCKSSSIEGLVKPSGQLKLKGRK